MNVRKGALVCLEPLMRFDFQFEPTEVRTTSGANYVEVDIPGYSEPMLQFSSGKGKRWEMELLMDALEDSDDVRNRVAWLEGFTLSDFGAAAFEPPPLYLYMGGLIVLVRLLDVNTRYPLSAKGRDGNLRSVRAFAQVTFQAVTDVSTNRVLAWIKTEGGPEFVLQGDSGPEGARAQRYVKR